MRKLSLLFPIAAAFLSIAMFRMGINSEFLLTLVLISLICITGIPFNYAILSVSKRDPMAKKVSVIFPLAIWLIFSVLRLAFSSSEIVSTLTLSLTVLAGIGINMIPLWITLFKTQSEGNAESGHKELFYWSWPIIIPLLFALYMGVSPRIMENGNNMAHIIIPILITLMAFSFVIYGILLLVKKTTKA